VSDEGDGDEDRVERELVSLASVVAECIDECMGGSGGLLEILNEEELEVVGGAFIGGGGDDCTRKYLFLSDSKPDSYSNIYNK
jgi:hypothetical protein